MADGQGRSLTRREFDAVIRRAAELAASDPDGGEGALTEDELFPEAQSGALGLPLSAWEDYDEPYKISYREYVQTQREKDAGVYTVKAALARANFLDQAEPGWITIVKQHLRSSGDRPSVVVIPRSAAPSSASATWSSF